MKRIETFTKSEIPAVEVVDGRALEELNAIATRMKLSDLALNRMRMDA